MIITRQLQPRNNHNYKLRPTDDYLFSPPYPGTPPPHRPNHALDEAKDGLLEYTAAESYGRDVGNCDLAYSSCPLTLGELLKTGVSILQGSMSRFVGM